MILATSFVMFALPLSAQASEISVIIDGAPLHFDVSPQIIDGRTMVPMRAIFEALGASVEWDSQAQMVTATTSGGDRVVLVIGSRTISVGNAVDAMDSVPMIIDGRTMVPARFVAQAMGMYVDWDADTSSLIITNPRVVTVATNINDSFALTVGGTLWRWHGFESAQNMTPHRERGGVVHVALGQQHTMMILEDGSLWARGNNQSGQLGDGTESWRADWTKIMDDVVSVSTSDQHTLAIRMDGSLWAWGRNRHGQLGDGTTEQRLRPVWIMDDVVAVSTASTHTLAICTDSSLWAWGANWGGEIGYGEFGHAGVAVYEHGSEAIPIMQLRPVRIMDGVIDVHAGWSRSMAITHDAGLWFWGSENFISPQYGWVTSRTFAEPTRIMEDVTAISSGIWHNVALRTDGSLWAWGVKDYGALDSYTNMPDKVMDGVVGVAAGSSNTMAIRDDGSVWGWGWRFGREFVELEIGL